MRVLQLTDDIEQSIAGAVRRFLEACRYAILQASKRTADQALAMSGTRTTNATNVFENDDNDDKPGRYKRDERGVEC